MDKISCIEWSGNSLDLNSIENLWAIINARLPKRVEKVIKVKGGHISYYNNSNCIFFCLVSIIMNEYECPCKL